MVQLHVSLQGGVVSDPFKRSGHLFGALALEYQAVELIFLLPNGEFFQRLGANAGLASTSLTITATTANALSLHLMAK